MAHWMDRAERNEERKEEHNEERNERTEISLLRELVSVVQRIERKLPGDHPVSFDIQQIGPFDSGGSKLMAIKGIAPGGMGTFVATPKDTNGNTVTLPAGVVPAWVSSDTVNTAVTPSADGLSANVSVASAAVPGTPFTLTVSAKNPDGSTPSGNASVPVLTITAVVTSFAIDQTA